MIFIKHILHLKYLTGAIVLIIKGMKSNYRGKLCKFSLGKKYPRGSHHYNAVYVLQKSVEESLVLLALFFLRPC